MNQNSILTHIARTRLILRVQEIEDEILILLLLIRLILRVEKDANWKKFKVLLVITRGLLVIGEMFVVEKFGF